jgi:CBS domain-containing protein
MLARDVMTHDVITVESDGSAMQAVTLMLSHRVSGLPVVDATGNLVGIVTEGDFLRRAELGTQRRRPRWLEFLIGPGRLASEYVHACGRRVEEIMTPDPCTIVETAPLAAIVELMERHRIKRVPVVRAGKPVGIVSRANLLQALASLARESDTSTADDATIREHVLAELGKRSWAPLGMINVIVRNGIVEIWGSILDHRECQAIVVAAENVAGVKGVRDHLVCIEPMSGMAVLPEGPATELAPAAERVN